MAFLDGTDIRVVLFPVTLEVKIGGQSGVELLAEGNEAVVVDTSIAMALSANNDCFDGTEGVAPGHESMGELLKSALGELGVSEENGFRLYTKASVSDGSSTGGGRLLLIL